jgi:hypothetical protein
MATPLMHLKPVNPDDSVNASLSGVRGESTSVLVLISVFVCIVSSSQFHCLYTTYVCNTGASDLNITVQ